nr:MAG TPA: hypothetical protein [Caudoviricetes sp.]
MIGGSNHALFPHSSLKSHPDRNRYFRQSYYYITRALCSL